MYSFALHLHTYGISSYNIFLNSNFSSRCHLIMQSAAFGAVSRNSRAAVVQQTDDIIANNHHHLSFIIIALCLTIRATNAVCSRLQK